MMKNIAHRARLAPFFFLAVFATGCRTKTEPMVRPLSGPELKTFYSQAQDPRRFWITVYNTDKGPVFTGQNRLHSSQFVGLPFLSRQHPDVPVVQIDAWRRRKFAALIDTTSARSWLTMDAFRAMQGVPLGPPAYRFPARHVTDEPPGYIGVVNKVRFDHLHMEDAVFCARGAFGPIGRLARGIKQPKIECVMGLDMVQSFRYVQINYPLKSVVLSSATGYAPEESMLVASIPYHEAGGSLAVYGKVNGQETTILVDTAGDFTFVAKGEAFTVVRQLELDNLVFRNVEVDDPEHFDLGLLEFPRIGNRLLQRFRVTIDSGSKVIHFEKPDTVRR